MTIPENPIGNRPKDPYADYKPERIEEKKKEQESSEEELAGAETAGALLLIYFKKLTDLFSWIVPQNSSQKGEEKLKGSLILFKAALDTMKTDDKSQDLAFLNRLAELWHQVIHQAVPYRNDRKLIEPLQALLKEIEHYPEREANSLGYYLKEGAGQRWIPFPYMELIQTLHRRHTKDPALSPLSRWTQQIEQLLPRIEPNQ